MRDRLPINNVFNHHGMNFTEACLTYRVVDQPFQRRARTSSGKRSSLALRLARWALMGCFVQGAIDTLPAQPRRVPADSLAEIHYKSGEAVLRSFAPVAAAASGSVVYFQIAGDRVALGTVVDAAGLVLTKASEVAGVELTCRGVDGTTVPARVLGVADDNDLALVKVEAVGLRPVVWATGTPPIGQWVVTPGTGAQPEAVGIISAPPRRVLHRRALIGVELDPNHGGPRIAKLVPGLGAEQAGLAPGDLVLTVNESPVKSREEMVQLLRQFREGQTVRLSIERAAATLEFNVVMMAPTPHPAGREADRGERMNRMGSAVSLRADGFDEVLTHDTVLQAWQCGGPLLNLDGEAVGLNIARAGRTASYALPARRVQEIAENLMISELPQSIPRSSMRGALQSP